MLSHSGQPATPHAPSPFKFGVTPNASGSQPSTSSVAPAPSWPSGPALFSFGIPPTAAAPSSHLAQDNAPSTGQLAASKPLTSARQVPALPQDQRSTQNKDNVDKQSAEASKPAANPSGWAPLAMQSNQAATTQAAEAAAADAAKQTTATTPEAVSAAATAAAAPLAASGGNDCLHSNQQAAAKATEAVAGGAKGDKPSGFTTLPAPMGGAHVMHSNQAAASQATQAAADAADEKASISQPAPVAFGWGADSMQSSQAAASQATQVAADAAKEKQSISQPAAEQAVASGWGAGSMQTNQAAAAPATEAAAQAANEGKGTYTKLGMLPTVPSVWPAFRCAFSNTSAMSNSSAVTLYSCRQLSRKPEAFISGAVSLSAAHQQCLLLHSCNGANSTRGIP